MTVIGFADDSMVPHEIKETDNWINEGIYDIRFCFTQNLKNFKLPNGGQEQVNKKGNHLCSKKRMEGWGTQATATLI